MKLLVLLALWFGFVAYVLTDEAICFTDSCVQCIDDCLEEVALISL